MSQGKAMPNNFIKRRREQLRQEARARGAKFIVRLFDMFDGWMDITEPISRAEAEKLWNEKTDNGTRSTEHLNGSGRQKNLAVDADYYKVFSEGTRMLYTPEFLGR